MAKIEETTRTKVKESVRHLQWCDWTKFVMWTVSNTAWLQVVSYILPSALMSHVWLQSSGFYTPYMTSTGILYLNLFTSPVSKTNHGSAPACPCLNISLNSLIFQIKCMFILLYLYSRLFLNRVIRIIELMFHPSEPVPLSLAQANSRCFNVADSRSNSTSLRWNRGENII